MSLLFNRRYRLRFGQPGEKGREVTELRIAFVVEKDSSSEANTATIQVWNLSETSRAELLRSGCTVSLEAGYGDEIGMIFQGNDLKLNIRRDLPDVITELKSQDGGEQLKTQIVNIGFEPGATIKDMVRNIVGTFKDITTNGIDIDSLPDDKAPSGWIASGPAKAILDKILKPRGVQFSVQDGEVRIVADTATTNDGAIKLTPSTGMVGSPTKTEDGVNVTSLLAPKLRVYRQVQIESDTITGIYKCDKVTHRGDSWGGDWYSVAECRSQ